MQNCAEGTELIAWHAEVYEREVEGMLEEVEAQYGTREFVGVHARVEGDWEQQCRAAQNRTNPSTMLFDNKHQCWVRCLLTPSPAHLHGSCSCACSSAP